MKIKSTINFIPPVLIGQYRGFGQIISVLRPLKIRGKELEQGVPEAYGQGVLIDLSQVDLFGYGTDLLKVLG